MAHFRITSNIIIILLLLLYVCEPVHACRCIRRTLPEIYYDKTTKFVLHIFVKYIERTPTDIIHHATVLKSFKGCAEDYNLQEKDVKIRSPINSCFVSLDEGKRYLVTVYANDCIKTGTLKKALYIDGCGYNRLWDSLDKNDVNFLMSRQICCDNSDNAAEEDDSGSCECAHENPPVACTKIACTAREPCDEGISCQTNFCGDCASEHFTADNHKPVCTACEEDFDCASEQVCIRNPHCGVDPKTCSKPKICRTECNPYIDFDTCPLGSECRSDGLCYNLDVDNTPFKLYTSCGDPVCRGHNPTDEYDPCSEDILSMIGGPCKDETFICDPKEFCNALVVCAKTDPKLQGCPKSRRKYKRDIQYIDSYINSKHHHNVKKAAIDSVLSMRLATYKNNNNNDDGDENKNVRNVYLEEEVRSSSSSSHDNFIVEENGFISSPRSSPSSLIDGNNNSPLDLYKYVSMTIATIQNQEKDLSSLRNSVEEIKANLMVKAKGD